jgi:hypothetical protein
MASQYGHGCTYDVFVSYSSRDAEWVKIFLSELARDTNRFADHDIFLFRDEPRLQPGFVWDDALLSAAADSAVLLPILSPRFLQSDYCQKEVNTFLNAFGVKSNVLHRSRILPVKLLCAAPKDHALAAFQATVFCSEGADNIPVEFRPDSAEYREAIRRLAYSIAQLLKSVPPRDLKMQSVYVALDFRPETDRLRASLAHKYVVLPTRPHELLKKPAAELDQALSADFDRCFASVHTLSGAPLAKPLIDAQLDAARKHAKPRIVLAASCPPADLLNEGFEWLPSQTEVEERIRRLSEKPTDGKLVGKELLIYFLCPDRRNKDTAEPLLIGLEAKGIHVYPSPLEGPADQALRTHVMALDELDGCLIYYGDVGQDWFDSVFLRLAKKIRQRRLPSVIFVAPPPTDHKIRDIKNLGLRLVSDADAAANAFLADSLGALAAS